MLNSNQQPNSVSHRFYGEEQSKQMECVFLDFPERNYVRCINNGEIRYITSHSTKECFLDDGKVSRLKPSPYCYYDNYEVFYLTPPNYKN